MNRKHQRNLMLQCISAHFGQTVTLLRLTPLLHVGYINSTIIIMSDDYCTSKQAAAKQTNKSVVVRAKTGCQQRARFATYPHRQCSQKQHRKWVNAKWGHCTNRLKQRQQNTQHRRAKSPQRTPQEATTPPPTNQTTKTNK